MRSNRSTSIKLLADAVGSARNYVKIFAYSYKSKTQTYSVIDDSPTYM